MKVVGPPLTLNWLVGGVVVHVALAGMTLAPGVFMWNDVFRFGKIEGAPGSGQESGQSCPPAFDEMFVMTVAAVIVGR